MSVARRPRQSCRRRLRQHGSQAELTHGARDYAALAKIFSTGQTAADCDRGLSGTGKPLLARAWPGFPPLPGAVKLRSDVERKALFRVGETDRLPDRGYSVETTARVYTLLAEKARRVTAAGYSVIVDAVFAEPAERTAIANSANGVPFQGLFLTASLETRIARREKSQAASITELAL
jgi:predicted kinase